MLRLRWLAWIWFGCCAACSSSHPSGSSAETAQPATAEPAATTSAVTRAPPSPSAARTKRSERIIESFVVDKPKDMHWRIFGLVPCSEGWCVGVESMAAGLGLKNRAVAVGLGRITPAGLLRQSAGPSNLRLYGIAPSGSAKSPWWIYGEIEQDRNTVFAVRTGAPAKELFVLEGDDAIRFHFGSEAAAAWVPADPLRGIVYWRQMLTKKPSGPPRPERYRHEHFLPDVQGYAHHVMTLARGKSHRRKHARPKGHDWRPILQSTLVSATDSAFLLVMADADQGIEAQWLTDDGATRQRATQEQRGHWTLEAGVLMKTGAVVLAGKMGSPLADEQPLVVGGFDAKGATVALRHLAPVGDRTTELLGMFECGSSAWLIRRNRQRGGDVESLDGYRLADASPVATRLWEGKVPSGHAIDHVFTACKDGVAALVASDRARFGRVSIVAFATWRAG